MKKHILIVIVILSLFSCSETSESRDDRYNELIEKGQSKIDMDELTEAIFIYKEAIKVDENRPEAYYDLGFIYTKKCSKTEHGAIAYDCMQAIEYFDKVVEIDSSYRNTYLNRAYCLMATDQLEEALKDYDNQIVIDDSDPDFFQGRGWCRLLLQDTIGACADYRQSIKLGNTEHEEWINREVCKNCEEQEQSYLMP